MELNLVEKKVIEIDEAIITRRSDGVIHVTFKEKTELDPALQDKLVVIYNELSEGVKRPFLYTAFNDVTVTKEAREYSLELENVYPALASAIVASTLAYKIIANFYLKVNKPKTPYKVFSTIHQAEEWLKTFLK